MSKPIFLLTIFLLSVSLLSAQQLKKVQGDVIVQLTKDANLTNIISSLQYFQREPTSLKVEKNVSKPLNIWLLHFDHTVINEIRFLEFLRNHPEIQIAQFNHLVTMRSTFPDDAFFPEQWQYLNDGSNNGLAGADIDADLAWDIATGGLTPLGDTIVVAVLDDGIDTSHEDFGDNLWVNHGEIPDNGIDDDENGYTDDYLGWNSAFQNGNIGGGGHGTPVAGIIGARGNNAIGVTGINWNVKIMIIKNNFNTNEAAVLAAYGYALDARLKYNDTNGAEGAFVVATNASWGVDLGDPADAPLWCAFYDELGEAGIVSCGATINGNTNVDEEGDLPTACPSDFLISVTNTNRMDIKVNNAGYGATTIDLGAPGAEAYTASSGNSYGNFGGTSGATPHVTGTVALLYAAPCDNLTILAKQNPAAAAALARQYIFDGVDPKPTLEGITVTGGRLNVNNSMQLLMANCVDCPQAFSLAAEDLTDVSTNLTWEDGINAISSNLRWREVGTAIWTEVMDASSPFSLLDLTACTEYEFQIDAVCDSENSGYTDSFVFTTDGCCEAPEMVSSVNINATTVTISWGSVLAAQSYNLLYASDNDGGFLPGITEDSVTLEELIPCNEYTILIQTVCDGQTTGFSVPYLFTTLGCGACTDLIYCESMGTDAEFEWIESITVGDFTNASGPNDGYGNFTDTTSSFMTFNNYDISLTPGYDGSAFPEYFKIWIDFNFDGEFDPETELAFDAGEGSTTTVNGSIFIPGDTPLGITRMRIGMEWIGIDNLQEPEACEIFQYGEVEDYCIQIIEGSSPSCDQPTDLDTLEVLQTSAILTWEDFTDDHIDHNLRIKKVTESTWSVFTSLDPPYTVTNLDDCTDYEFQVEANCLDNSMSTYTTSYVFQTKCILDIVKPLADEQVKIYPNPFSESIIIELNLSNDKSASILLFNSSGQLVFEKMEELFAKNQTIEIMDLNELPAGIYFLSISSPDGIIHHKLIKQ